ncbi:hypothetical protein NDU88_003093 [Pleurodeles waltl]|uniref:Uncharacterized protein n=1 Tax=Pleurodeles waltl TaxID=8319 RepID=A0AAV7MXI9_PLEWA|nr:hypothetical protein NDU88_003093 [Pleurodeles waltl]
MRLPSVRQGPLTARPPDVLREVALPFCGVRAPGAWASWPQGLSSSCTGPQQHPTRCASALLSRAAAVKCGLPAAPSCAPGAPPAALLSPGGTDLTTLQMRFARYGRSGRGGDFALWKIAYQCWGPLLGAQVAEVKLILWPTGLEARGSTEE